MTALAARLDAAIDAALEAERLVGCVVLVAVDGAVAYARAAGMRDREAGAPMQRDSIFRLASVTKTFVTAAAMRLVEENVVGLDEPTSLWLTRFHPLLPDGTEPDMTLRHLLTHTSGLGYGFAQQPGHPYHALGVSDGLDSSVETLHENLDRLAQAPLHFAPGERWEYGLSLDVAGHLLEASSGVPLIEIMRHAIIEPLGLHDLGFVAKDLHRLVVPYALDASGPVRMTDPYVLRYEDGTSTVFSPSRATSPQLYPSGGSGMVGTADEVLKLLEALRRDGQGILTPDSAGQMMSMQVGPENECNGPGWGFGLGGAVLADPAVAQVPHSPGTFVWGGAYGHHWFVDPAERITTVILTNTAPEGMDGPSAAAITQAVYG
ncbi:serine hydrolase domain-containing protein [Demequina capsici]|uniref:Serine hydrolase domain-containing protein n=1 Tax=Demequina capsici TaxID=3075620 RepID=A0AA96FEI1_9MICO|nr:MULTISPECIES: serine hydrolase domain-containing protein [unclassified Demequina]WNM24324.1 serine hydrolase domain-containing protein [Demequina sp. OYTSA14]WNM27146.1 serine hydrolase domain-containing protein [Demequina sp. PMTSA13]